MKIYLTTILENDTEVHLYYETLKPFNEHSLDVKTFIENQLALKQPIIETFENAGIVPRITHQLYTFSEELKFEKVYTYMYPPDSEKNGLMSSIEWRYYGN